MVSGAKAVCALTEGVTVVIPVWNRADLLQKLLETVVSQVLAPREVIVVDNGSTDGAGDVAASGGARVIAMGRNAGFASAVNRGIGESQTEWIAIVNSDVELEPGWLDRLFRAATETQAWFATGKILSASDRSRLDGAWDLVARSGCAWRAGHGRLDAPVFCERRGIAMTSATAALYRRELFERVGGFAEVYESYLEDVDLSLRCAAARLEGVYEPMARCFHRGSASSSPWNPRVAYLMSRNQAILVRRIFPAELRREWRWKILAGQWLWGLVALRHGRLWPWTRGKWDAMRGKWDARGLTECLQLDAQEIRKVVTNGEREIRALQSRHEDLYWRLYFLFTAGGSA